MTTSSPSTARTRFEGRNPAEVYEETFVPTIGTATAQALLDVADIRPGDRVLDVACGTGLAARLAAEIVGPGEPVTGVDVNPAMLAVARAATGERFTWHQAPADNLPLADGSYDVVLCSLGLQFFPDRVAALREARRVLAPGGRIAIDTPGEAPGAFAALEEALVEHVGPQAGGFVSAVFSLNDPEEVRGLLDAAGFEGVAVKTDTLTIPLAPPEAFLWGYVYGTPLAALVGPLDEGAKAALEADAVERCRPWVRDGRVVIDSPVILATASRGEG